MIKFKKVAAILATTFMLGSTVAAAYPGPFVVDGVADIAIVTGQNAALSDSSAAIDLMNNLNELVVPIEPTDEGTDSVFTGDNFLKLERGSDNFNLGDSMSDFYSKMDDDELPNILASDTYSNDINDEFDYDQEITFGENITLKHFQDNDFNNEKPVVGFALENGDEILTYTLDFDDAADAGGNWTAGNDLESTEITILGKEYHILTARQVGGDYTLTLLDSASSKIVAEGETSTILAGDESYTISIDYINQEDAIFNINGVNTNKLGEGEVYKLDNNNYLSLKEVLYNGKDTGISKAEISIGSGEIVLQDGAEVEINGEDVDDMEFTMEGSEDDITYSLVSNLDVDANQNLNGIELVWSANSDAWLTPSTELVMPGLNSIKLSIDDFEFNSEEVTEIEDNSEGIVLKTYIADGDIDLPILYVDGSTDKIKGLGEDDSNKLVTNASASPTLTLKESEDSYFVATWLSGDDAESYVYQLDRIDDDGKTVLSNLAGGDDITIDAVDEYETEGEIKYTLVSADEPNGIVNIKVEPISGGDVYTDRIVTEEGLQMMLPIADSNTIGNTTWTMQVTEEDSNENIAAGSSFDITLRVNDDAMHPTSVSSITTYETSDDSEEYEGYMVSDLATNIVLDKSGDLNRLEITYSGEESSAEVFISETIAGFESTDTILDAVEQKVIVVTDNEIDSVKGKNLIVVGGSCINTVAANILGGAYCGEAFTENTNVAVGQHLVKTITSPYASDKIAMLVAGYDAIDTEAGVQKVKAGTMSTNIGYSEVY